MTSALHLYCTCTSSVHAAVEGRLETVAWVRGGAEEEEAGAGGCYSRGSREALKASEKRGPLTSRGHCSLTPPPPSSLSPPPSLLPLSSSLSPPPSLLLPLSVCRRAWVRWKDAMQERQEAASMATAALHHWALALQSQVRPHPRQQAACGRISVSMPSLTSPPPSLSHTPSGLVPLAAALRGFSADAPEDCQCCGTPPPQPAQARPLCLVSLH